MQDARIDMAGTIRCRDCRFFQLDVWGNAGGFPLIVAHEMCSRWGGGCKTSPDGFCFMAEARDEGHEDNETDDAHEDNSGWEGADECS